MSTNENQRVEHMIFLADTCWALGCDQPAYITFVADEGHTFRCRECAVDRVGERYVAAGEKLRERVRENGNQDA